MLNLNVLMEKSEICSRCMIFEINNSCNVKSMRCIVKSIKVSDNLLCATLNVNV